MAYEVCSVVVKTALNVVVPGSGAALDFAETVGYLYNGNYAEAALSAVSGTCSLVTLGFGSRIKEAMKVGAKTAIIQTAKESTKSAGKDASKKIGQKVAKEIAQGVITKTVDQVWDQSTKMTFKKISQNALFSSISSGGCNVLNTILKDFSEETLTTAWQKWLPEMMKKYNRNFVFEFTKSAAERGAVEGLKKHSYKLFVKDSIFSFVKGAINLPWKP